MGYSVYSLRGGRSREESEAEEFFEAAEKARKAVEKMHDLACEMEDRYSERSGYGSRGDYGRRGYGRRDHEDWERDEWSERRMRDSRGRYM